jgi:AcrR family transcriptional regulator
VTTRETGHRAALIDGALQCLEEKGYARTTTRDIVAASGTNLGSIVYHFGTKERLLNEALAEGFARWVEEVERADKAHAELHPVARLGQTLAATLATFESYRGLYLAFVEAAAQVEHSEELRRTMAVSYERTRARSVATISEAIPGTSEPHARALASLVIAVIDGLMLQWLFDAERAPSIDQVRGALAGLLEALA